MREEGSERDEREPRRRYEPPRVLETAEFETLALACGKIGDQTVDCLFEPGQS
jgi:hypothetical protein